MKISSTSSILLASLAVSSSALVMPSPDSQQESGLSSSISQETLASQDTAPSGRRDSVSARGLPSLGCDIAQVLALLVPVDLKEFCPSNAKQGEGDRSPGLVRVQQEMAQLNDTSDKATFPPIPGSAKPPVDGNPAAALLNESPVAPLASGGPAAAPSDGSPAVTPSDGSPVAAALAGSPAAAVVAGSPAAAAINGGGGPVAAAIAGSPAAAASSGNPVAAALAGSPAGGNPAVAFSGGNRADGSSTWGVQPTPTNSPTLPVDDPASHNATTSSTA